MLVDHRPRRSRKPPHLKRVQAISLAVVILLVIGVIAWRPLAPAASDTAPQTRDFTLTAEEIDWELEPGAKVRAWAYNGQVPGPEIRAREGDRVRITLINKLPVGTTIHWHGVNVQPAMDGPAGLNQAPVESGETFTYDFIATPAGTRWYHSHTDVATQVMLGLYGAFIVEPKKGGAQYDRDDTYILSEWDNELTPAVAVGAEPRGPRDATLRGGEFGTDAFLMNGHMHEAIPPIKVKEGDRVLIRLINAGTLAHPFHTHGHSFKIVATDGNPVPEAAQITKDTVLIAPGERYDLAFDANNPGVWMVHCHIENHAANGMMTLIEYEGYAPTGPLKEFWDQTPAAAGSPGAGAGMDEGADSMHGMHGGSDPMAEPSKSMDTTPTPEPAITSAPAPTAGIDAAAEGNDAAKITMLDDRFEPNTLTVPVGTTVTWINKGADWHSVSAFGGSFESEQIASGDSFSYTFDTPGKYQFLCRHHGRQGMIGQITVTE
jgi:FtsP/CotA-like multicopper oxidase with cupredoxin domain